MKTFLYILLFILSQKLMAQQDPLVTQYMNNKYLFNPAFAGYNGQATLGVVTREQWLGFKNAPSFYTLYYQGRFMKSNNYKFSKLKARLRYNRMIKKGRIGLGLAMYSSSSNVTNRTGFLATYAYHIKLRGHGQLSFGLSANVYNSFLNKDKVILYENDNWLNNSDLNYYVADFFTGTLFTRKNLFLGLSVSQLSQSNFMMGTNLSNNLKLMRHYYLIGGINIRINEDFQYEPAVLYKTTEQFKMQLDISHTVTVNNLYWFGTTYRSGAKAGVMSLFVGAVFNQFKAGYAFDYNFSNIMSYTFGSHEISIFMFFGSDDRRTKWMERY